MSNHHQKHSDFDLQHTLHELKHYLPSQAPLKDFIHHNTLHAFQHNKFYTGLQQAAEVFGFRTYLNLSEFRQFYAVHHIDESVLDKILQQKKGKEAAVWKQKLLEGKYNEELTPRIGQLRDYWKSAYKINLDKEVHSLLFKIIGAFLDQGVSVWNLPTSELGFLPALHEMEKVGFSSFFQTKKVRQMLLEDKSSIEDLLKILGSN